MPFFYRHTLSFILRIAAIGFAVAASPTTSAADPLAAQQAGGVPQFQVDPFWPKPLPNNWILGQVSGVAVDRHNHIWIIHRPRSLSDREVGVQQNPSCRF